MPSNPKPPQRAAKPKTPHPYRRANPPAAGPVAPWPRRQTNPIPEPPPPPPEFERKTSVLGLLDEQLTKLYPGFVWKNDYDILLAGNSFDKPKDNAGLRRYLDERLEDCMQKGWQLDKSLLMVRDIKRSEVLGTKPDAGQRTESHIIPSCPSISVRLWTSSPSMKNFCMDFVDTETGVSVNVFHRFKAYGGGYMLGGSLTMPLRPLTEVLRGMLDNMKAPGAGPAQETYLLNERQTVTIEDTKSKDKGDDRFLSFKVPNYPGARPNYPVQLGHVAHFSFDE